MTINAIIEQLYNSKEVDDCIKKMVRKDHQDDFKQELFLKIYEIPEERLVMLYENNGLKFYIVRSLINLVKNGSSVYNKNYIRPERDRVGFSAESKDENETGKMKMVFIDNTDPDELVRREKSEQKEAELIHEINNCFDEEFGTYYYRMLVHMIAELGSMRAVSRQTGIPIASISEAIKKVRNHLKNKCYNDPEKIKGIY